MRTTIAMLGIIAGVYTLGAGFCGLQVANTALPHAIRANYYMMGVVSTAVALVGFACCTAVLLGQLAYRRFVTGR